MEPRDRVVRKFVLDYFLASTNAPAAEEIARDLHEPLSSVRLSLQNLDESHHVKLVDGTSRILMAFPFSAIATPFRVTRGDGRRYYANCAWDSIAFYPMLREPIRVDSFCGRCGGALGFSVRDGSPFADELQLPSVRLGLPAAEWWKDIIRTCANTMTFLCPNETSRDRAGSDHLGILSIEQVLQLSEPIYAKKLELGYERPSTAVLQSSFSRLGLTGPYWTL